MEGERDDIRGRGQTHAAYDLRTELDVSRKHRMTAAACGHCSVFSGSARRTVVCPQLRGLVDQQQSHEVAELRTEFLENFAA